MKKRDNQKMHMYAAVLQICKDEQTTWENLPGFVAAVQGLETKLDELHQLYTEHDGAIVGVSADKNEFKADLAEHLFVISKALRAKGMLAGNKGLYMRNKISLSVLKGLSANDLIHRMNAVAGDLVVHGDALTDYGVTPILISETQGLIEQASKVLFQPRKAIIERKELTEIVKGRIRVIDQLLTEQLDAFIVSFKSSLPSFYNKYRTARIIIDYGHGSKTPEPDDGSDV